MKNTSGLRKQLTRCKGEWIMLAFLILCVRAAWADQVEMKSGERFIGKVLSLSNDTLVVQSEALGIVRLPRAKVASVSMSSGAETNSVKIPAVAGQAPRPVAAINANTNSNAELTAAVRQLNGRTNLVQQVEEQFLVGADPQAKAKFNDLVSGLMSGKLGLNDIRSEALSATEQLKGLKRELGEDSTGTLDMYLGLLEGFLRETTPAGGSVTNAGRALPKSGAAEANEE
jgi:hypothetical protein